MAIQDSGSNYQFYDKKIRPNVNRSSFQLDYLSTFTANQGALIPYRIQETLPNSEYNLSLECLSRAINVPKVILQSRQRIFFHEYHTYFQQMWPEWSTFMSKGVSGKVVKLLPRIRFSIGGRMTAYYLRNYYSVTSSQLLVDNDSPYLRNEILNWFGLGFGSLADYLGFPTPQSIHDGLDSIFANLKANFEHYQNATSSNIYVDFDAFPFFAYYSIYRNFYLNWNLNSTDKKYFPDNVNDFALLDPDVGDNIFYACWDAARNIDWNSYPDRSNLSLPAKGSFGLIKYRNFVDDYFTAALPWPMRGDVPELSLDGTATMENVPVGVRDENGKFQPLSSLMRIVNVGNGFFPDGTNGTALTNILDANPGLAGVPVTNLSQQNAWEPFTIGGLYSNTDTGLTEDLNARLSLPLYANAKSAPINYVSGFTWEMIRNLSTATLIAEKMARTNGSYKEFIQTFFNDVPSNQVNNVPRYVGGTFQPIVYTEVLQTSSDSNTPLGTPGAKGISSSDDYIGKVYSNDYGLILGILSIMPDTYYSQGLRRQNLYEVQEDFYLPERAELGMQGVLKGELFFTGNDSQDNSLFGYQNRYDEWRYRSNEIHGEVANPNNKSYFPFTQSRYFTGAPVLSNEFVTTRNNIRRDYLTSLKEVDFLVQVANKCTAVQPLPYRAVPVGLKD